MHFSSQAQLLAHRALQKKHQILPVHPVVRLLSVIFHPHELVVRHETLLEQLARYPVIREQADQPAVPRHHYEHVSRLGFAVVCWWRITASTRLYLQRMSVKFRM